MVIAQERRRGEYNYEHFQAKHFLTELRWTMRGEGAQPGHEAPDFELDASNGARVRLSALRGRPVLVHFGNET
jgi:cytochrome oxidase Cu insertion factor (SCO1/SenC/PrrC family)